MVLSSGHFLRSESSTSSTRSGGQKLTPRDPALQISMNQISPVISKETTMWRRLDGLQCHPQHGAILFGLVFGYLALAHGQLLFQSLFPARVGLAMLSGLVVVRQGLFFQCASHRHLHFGLYVASMCLRGPDHRLEGKPSCL